MCAFLLVTSLSVFAGYSAKGFGDMNQYYATLSAQSTEIRGETTGSGSKTTIVYGTMNTGQTLSSSGASVASVGRTGSNIFLRANSVHWVGNDSTTLFTNV